MNRTAFGLWISICWIVTVGLAYMVGWYKGVRSITTAATENAFPVILGVLAVVALVSAIAAFKTRGYFANRKLRQVEQH